jgi:hypothetical protein
MTQTVGCCVKEAESGRTVGLARATTGRARRTVESFMVADKFVESKGVQSRVKRSCWFDILILREGLPIINISPHPAGLLASW